MLINRRTFLGAIPASGAVSLSRSAGAQQAAPGGPVVIALPGTGGDLLKPTILDRFDQLRGGTTSVVAIQSAAAYIRMRAEAADPQIDVYLFSGGQELLAASEGLSADLRSLPSFPDLYPKFRDPGGKWVCGSVDMEGVLYRTDKFPQPPRSYRDLLEDRLVGHVAIPTIANGFGTDLLVMMARTFGGGETNIDPGFKALAKLAQHATIFRATSELLALFSQQDIWAIPYNARFAYTLSGSGLPIAFAIMDEGAPIVPYVYCAAAKSKHLPQALAALEAIISADGQIVLAEQMHLSPTNSQVKLPEQVAAKLAKPDQLVTLDQTTMTKSRSEWTERWNQEIAH